MKTPKFFSENYNNWLFFIFLSPVLKLISFLYKTGFKIHSYYLRKKKIKIKPTVICIGNIVVGGSGKTEIVLSICRILKDSNKKVAILTKGYGRKSKDCFFIKKGSEIPVDKIGDEASFLKEEFDVFVLNKRAKIIEFEALKNYDYIIMDDGMQDLSIHQDYRFIVFDINFFMGNKKLLPAGPLRQYFFTPNDNDFIILAGQATAKQKKERLEFLKGHNVNFEKVFFTNTKILSTHDKKKQYFAFSGIGQNSKFFDFLEKNSFLVHKKLEFSDHHNYTEKEINRIISFAEKENLSIITTKKDYIKVPKKLKENIEYLQIELEIEDLDLF